MKFEKGWLKRQIEAAAKEVDSWPDWKKRAYKICRGEYDPVYKCEVYLEHGCSHVDGFLCDMKTCSMLREYRIKDWSID